jgi:uncharacterized protein (DUF2267 family)
MNIVQKRPDLAAAVLEVFESAAQQDRVLEVLSRMPDEVLDTVQMMSVSNYDEWTVFCEEVARGKRLFDENDAEAILEHQDQLIDAVDAQL